MPPPPARLSESLVTVSFGAPVAEVLLVDARSLPTSSNPSMLMLWLSDPEGKLCGNPGREEWPVQNCSIRTRSSRHTYRQARGRTCGRETSLSGGVKGVSGAVADRLGEGDRQSHIQPLQRPWFVCSSQQPVAHCGAAVGAARDALALLERVGRAAVVAGGRQGLLGHRVQHTLWQSAVARHRRSVCFSGGAYCGLHQTPAAALVRGRVQT